MAHVGKVWKLLWRRDLSLNLGPTYRNAMPEAWVAQFTIATFGITRFWLSNKVLMTPTKEYWEFDPVWESDEFVANDQQFRVQIRLFPELNYVGRITTKVFMYTGTILRIRFTCTTGVEFGLGVLGGLNDPRSVIEYYDAAFWGGPFAFGTWGANAARWVDYPE